jgi:hypothetical protein
LREVNVKQCVALHASRNVPCRGHKNFAVIQTFVYENENIDSNVHKSNNPIFECQISHKYSNPGMLVIGITSAARCFALEGEKSEIQQCTCHSSKQ